MSNLHLLCHALQGVKSCRLQMNMNGKLPLLNQDSSCQPVHERPSFLLLPPLGACKEKYNPCSGLSKEGKSLISQGNASFETDPTLKASGKRCLEALLMTTCH